MHQLLEAVRKINTCRKWKLKLGAEPRVKAYKRGVVQKITVYPRPDGNEVVAELRSHPLVDKVHFSPLSAGREKTFEFSFKTEGGVRSTIVSPEFKATLEQLGYSINSNYYSAIDRTTHHIWHGPHYAGDFSTKEVEGKHFPIYLTAHEAHVEPIVKNLFGGLPELPKARKRLRQ